MALLTSGQLAFDEWGRLWTNGVPGGSAVNDTLRQLDLATGEVLYTLPLDGTLPNNVWGDFAGGSASPTAAVVASFGARSQGNRVVVEWKTASEVGTAGFYLERFDAARGAFERVNSVLVPGLLTAAQGGTYRLVDPSAKAGEAHTYRLIEVECRGGRRTYGPYRVTVTPAAADDDVRKGAPAAGQGDELRARGYSRTARRLAGSEPPGVVTRALGLLKEAGARKARAQAKAAAAATALAVVPGALPAVKIAVKEHGLYVVSAAEIAPLLRVSEKALKPLIRNGMLSLTCQGKPVRYRPAADGSGLLFYGQGIQSIYTDENIYWLAAGRGRVMATVAGSDSSK